MQKLTFTLTMGLLATLFGCGQGKTNNTTSDSLTTEPITKPIENIIATKDQRDRRFKSENSCREKLSETCFAFRMDSLGSFAFGQTFSEKDFLNLVLLPQEIRSVYSLSVKLLPRRIV